ncbi:MAG: serine--tRNA ligase [Deltaproteobacteria bacterium]|nr:serine--tRNA ligase [Deltaproteobacteria bacterium]
MHDLKWVIDNLDEARQRFATRGEAGANIDRVVRLAEERRRLVTEHNTKRYQQNQLSAQFPRSAPPEEQAAFRENVKLLKAEVAALEVQVAAIESELEGVLMLLPNLPQPVTPVGASEADNVVLRTWGEPLTHPFAALEHDVLGERLGILDFDAASRISGAGFALYRGLGARLERAVASFFLEHHVEHHGYEEVLTPFIVREECMVGTGQLPKFREEAYVTEPDQLFLIPTAEVSITNIFRGQMLDGERLPKKLCGWSPCFRREAGSHGREVRGLTRVHQFQKVELVHVTTAEDSLRAHEELVGHAEKMLQLLGLAYRVVDLCTADLGFGASRCYDLEVWLPAQKRWREISSCSNFLDFQARRADIRYRPEPGAKPRYAHTLNGSGLAVGRTVMAILEVHQTESGEVNVPEVLRPFMRVDRIGSPR